MNASVYTRVHIPYTQEADGCMCVCMPGGVITLLCVHMSWPGDAAGRFN